MLCAKAWYRLSLCLHVDLAFVPHSQLCVKKKYTYLHSVSKLHQLTNWSGDENIICEGVKVVNSDSNGDDVKCTYKDEKFWKICVVVSVMKIRIDLSNIAKISR